MDVPQFLALERRADRDGHPVPWELEGSQGKSYRIRASAFRAWHEGYEGWKSEQKAEVDAAVADLFPENERVAALKTQFGFEGNLGPDDYQKLLRIALDELKFEEQKRRLLPIGEAEQLIRRHHQAAVSVISSAESALVRELDLDAEGRATLRRVLDEAQAAAARALRAASGGDPGK